MSQETSRKTIEAIEQANQAYFWGLVCFKIRTVKEGSEYDLITQYDKIILQDGIDHSKLTWGSGTGFDIPDSTVSLTQEIVQKRICSSIISKWLTKSMTPEAFNGHHA